MEGANRREGGGVDGEERDLINFRSKESDTRVGVRQRESAIARRQLKRAVEEERLP